MKNDRRFYLLAIVLTAGFFQNISRAQTEPAPTPLVESTAVIKADKASVAEEDLIHFGDLIDVDVQGSTEYDWRGQLNPEGFLSGVIFTENPIYALCQSEEIVADKIAAAYARFLRVPLVAVKILDRSGRPFSLLYGAVRKNQRFQIKRRVFLNELIIISGGFTDRASGEIQILRSRSQICSNENSNSPQNQNQSSDSLYINVKIGELLAGKVNPQIYSGDVITVLEAKPIYVVGAVGVPKQLLLRSQQLTVSRAVDSAGGLLKNADAKKITIFRRGEKGAESKIIEIDLDKVKASLAEDIVLQAFDIVEVRQTGGEKRKFPPVLKIDSLNRASAQNLPLRIID